MCSRFILYYSLILLFVLYNLSFGSPIDEFPEKVDSLLLRSELHRSDLSIPSDIKFDFINELNISKNNRRNPIDAARNLIKEFYSIDKSLDNLFFKKMVDILGFKQIEDIPLTSSVSSNVMNINFNTNLDSLLSFQSGLVIRPYLNLYINTNANILKDALQQEKDTVNYFINLANQLIANNELHLLTDKADDLAKQNKVYQFGKIIDKSRIFDLAASLYHQIIQLNQRLRNLPDETKKSVTTTIIDTKYGKIAIGGTGDDKYEGNFIVIIDLGGDDKYNFSSTTQQLSYYSPIRFIVDIAGNDEYIGGDYSFGASFFGISMLFDYAGNDKYTAKNYSLGSAYFGVGILEDFDGNDVYKGGKFTQGVGFYGIGILRDDKGSDNYISENISQGTGLSRGFGLLNDLNGLDTYASGISQQSGKLIHNLSYLSQGSAAGMPMTGAGGVGLLIDANGDDKYHSEAYSQGFSAKGGIGALIDKLGDDSYSADRFSQASAHSGSFSFLIDSDGNDSYVLKSFSQAIAANFASTMLIDLNGNDKYSGKYINSDVSDYVSILYDTKGANIYQNVNDIEISTITKSNISGIGRINTFTVSDSVIDSSISVSDKKLLTNIANYFDEDLSKVDNYSILLDNLKLYVNDTLLFEQVLPNVIGMPPLLQSEFCYHYVLSAKNDNLLKSAIYYLSDSSAIVSQSAMKGLLKNPAINTNLLFQLVNSKISNYNKLQLIPFFAVLDFSDKSNKELRNMIFPLPEFLREKLYLELKNNTATKGLNSKLKYLIKKEQNPELRKGSANGK